MNPFDVLIHIWTITGNSGKGEGISLKRDYFFRAYSSPQRNLGLGLDVGLFCIQKNGTIPIIRESS